MSPRSRWGASRWATPRGSAWTPMPAESSRGASRRSPPRRRSRRRTSRPRRSGSTWSSGSRSPWTPPTGSSSRECPPTRMSAEGVRAAGPDDGCAVVTRQLTRRFGKRVAVDHLDLRVRAGELYGFLGPNGAGKSTTLRMLCGILEPSEGGGTVLDIDLVSEPERIKSVIGYMSQKFSLYDDLTVDENLTFYARVYEVPRAQRAARIAQMVRMADLTEREGQLAGTLSGGYRQRLALACALVHSPRLIFLDEPTAGVDPVSRRNFWGLIRRLADQGTTILVTTHYMDEAELCDTLGFIYEGKLIAQGAPAVIKSDTFRRPVIGVDVEGLRRASDLLADWDAVEEVLRVGTRLRVVLAEAAAGAGDVKGFLERAGLGV